MTGRRVRRPTLFSLWRKARWENSAASRLLGTTSLRFALHGWQWMMEELDEADNKDLTAALSIKAIDIIGSDPDRLGSRHHGDDSPWSHVLKTLTGRLFSGKGGEE